MAASQTGVPEHVTQNMLDAEAIIEHDIERETSLYSTGSSRCGYEPDSHRLQTAGA